MKNETQKNLDGSTYRDTLAKEIAALRSSPIGQNDALIQNFLAQETTKDIYREEQEKIRQQQKNLRDEKKSIANQDATIYMRTYTRKHISLREWE